MNQTKQLIKALKQILKAKGITYRDLGMQLQLSEASIKRLFSQQSFSLKRLDEICSLLEISFYELAKMMKIDEQSPLLDFLSIEQESHLAENPGLLLYFYLLINGWTFEEIIRSYEFSEIEATGKMLELDRLELIELFAENRFKLLVSKNFSWRKGGPVWERYKVQVQQEFFNSGFTGSNERLDLYTGELSEASRETFNRKLDRLLREFNELAEIDSALNKRERHAYGFIIGFRPWVFSILSAIQRQQEEMN
ncbi:MAG: helix-turn-helix transcriptional regulator [SAR324 cluster bacterium]|nr:helix-turn-helix transcriptional regulator [SAR324 cluster bacterium]